jgi:AraC-like DNA-binding protein
MTGSSLVLSIGVANALALASVLAVVPGNRAASHIMALLILLLAARVWPQLLGAWGVGGDPRSLVFVPLDFSYAFGPLLWLYVARLTHMPLSRGWRWHFVPTVVQFAYLSVCFLLPLETKWAWYSGGNRTLIGPIASTIGLASLTTYLILSVRLTDRYRAWVDSAFAERDNVRLFGLRALLIAFLVAIIGAAVTTAFMRLAPAHDFDARLPLMVVIAALTYALGLLGWRNASISFPSYRTLPEPAAPLDPRGPDDGYTVQAEVWRQRVQTSDWWRDETLDLVGLAARLGTTPRSLSRVIAEGAGENFRSFIGRIRVDAVCAAIEQSGDAGSLLDIALSCGFSSKASFNRVFMQHRRMTPSAYRAEHVSGRLKNSQSDMVAGFGATGGTT